MQQARLAERGDKQERVHLSAITLDGITRVARMLRSNGSWSHRSFQRTSRRPLAHYSFSPCPRNDLNGAEFLYLASFQAVVDRAEWPWWRDWESSIVP